MRRVALVLATTAVSVGGCAAEMPMIGPEPVVMLAIEPADGVTGWQGRDVTVAVEDPAHLLNPEGQADLTTHFYLRTWPEGVPIPVTTETIAGPTQWQWAVRLTPSLTLDDGWYVVGASNLSPRIVSAAKLPDGTLGVRFSPGSHPRVASVQLCEGGAPGMKVVLSFSEPVRLPADATETVSLTVNGQPAACTSYGTDAAAAYLTCADLVPAAPVTVSVPEGLAGSAGAPIEAGQWTIDVARLPSGGCQTYKPPILDGATLAGASPTGPDLPGAPALPRTPAPPAGWRPATLHPRE